MTRRRLATRRVLHGGSGALRLPNPPTGPFSDQTAPLISSLSNLTYNTNVVVNLGGISRTNQVVANHLVVTNNTYPYAYDRNGMWVWCNTIRIDSGSTMIASDVSLQWHGGGSVNGTDGLQSCPGPEAPGSGGDSGCSGGGGGAASAASDCFAPHAGGSGGNNSYGADGDQSPGCFPGGVGGLGGASFLTGAPAAWTATLPTVGTGTTPGVGRGGDGASVTGGGCVGDEMGGGGGGAGSPLIYVCNEVLSGGSIAFSGEAVGGNAGQSLFGAADIFAQGGQGGMILIYTKKWTGWSLANFGINGGNNEGGGTATSGALRIYEMNSAGVVVATHTNPLDTWNNL